MPAPSLFVGTPGESEDDFENTIQFILDHKSYLDVLNLYPFMVTTKFYSPLQKLRSG